MAKNSYISKWMVLIQLASTLLKTDSSQVGAINFSGTKHLPIESTTKTPGFASVDLTSVLATTINVANGSITVKNSTPSLSIAFEKKSENTTFYVVFVLKNNHKDVVSVTILKQGKSDSIQLNAGEKKVVVKHPKNQSPFTVEAKDTKGEIMNINGKSSISLTPQDSLGNLKLLEIDRLIPDPSQAGTTNVLKTKHPSASMTSTFNKRISIQSITIHTKHPSTSISSTSRMSTAMISTKKYRSTLNSYTSSTAIESTTKRHFASDNLSSVLATTMNGMKRSSAFKQNKKKVDDDKSTRKYWIVAGICVGIGTILVILVLIVVITRWRINHRTSGSLKSRYSFRNKILENNGVVEEHTF